MFDKIKHALSLRKGKPSIVSYLETWGTGIESEITMDKLIKYRDSNMKFRLTIMINTAYSVGIGFHNTADTGTPTGRRILETIDDFCDEWDIDSLNQSIAQDVWTTGNAFLRHMKSHEYTHSGVQILPVSSILRIKRDASGAVDHYEQFWGAETNYLPAKEVLHFKWLAENAGAWGMGLGQPLATPGEGYRTSNGKTIRRPSMFTIAEMMTDVEAKMVYAGLPRYDVYANVKDSTLDDITKSYSKTDPLQHMVHNFEGEVKAVSLDTQNKFDSFLRSLDDTFLAGIMTPIPRMFSSLNFTHASADASVDSYLPLIRMYQRAHKRFVENKIYKPILLEEYDNKAIKKSKIALNWGQQDEITFDEIKQVHEILKDPMFTDRFDPEDILDMIRRKVPQTTVLKKEMEQLDDRVKELSEITNRAEKKVNIEDLPPEDQYNVLRAQVLTKMVGDKK